MVFISIFLSITSGLLVLSDIKKCLKSNSLSSFAILLIRLTMTILESTCPTALSTLVKL